MDDFCCTSQAYLEDFTSHNGAASIAMAQSIPVAFGQIDEDSFELQLKTVI